MIYSILMFRDVHGQSVFCLLGRGLEKAAASPPRRLATSQLSMARNLLCPWQPAGLVELEAHGIGSLYHPRPASMDSGICCLHAGLDRIERRGTPFVGFLNLVTDLFAHTVPLSTVLSPAPSPASPPGAVTTLLPIYPGK